MRTIKRIFVILLAALLIISLLFLGCNTVLKMLFPTEHMDIILENCAIFDVNPYLVFALIKAESNFVSDAQSNKEAIGLMQITEPTAEWIAEKLQYSDYSFALLRKPEVNIHFGTWYLSYLLDEYNGDETLALCAYNAGRGNVDKWLQNAAYSSDGETLESIPFKETDTYIKKIAGYRKIYLYLYPNLHSFSI